MIYLSIHVLFGALMQLQGHVENSSLALNITKRVTSLPDAVTITADVALFVSLTNFLMLTVLVSMNYGI